MLFSRMVDPPSFFSTEIASTAIGIDALTVRPARSPRYTVDAPKIRPKMTPMTIALGVNSAGDCVGGTYGWNPMDGCAPEAVDRGAVVAMGGILACGFCYNPPWACENVEQRSREEPG